ncbi:MAG: hypothetical protein Kow00108_21240 [Calditrichia bacterium]
MSVSWSCVYATQLFYWYGLGGIWLITVPWVLALSAIYYLSAKYRQLPVFSQPEMAEMRYGKKGKIIIALALAFVFLIWGGAEVYIAAILLAPITPLSPFTAITIIVLIVGIYSLFGGFKAVISTDKLQYILVGLYIVIVAVLGIVAVNSTGINVEELFTRIPAKSTVPWHHLFSPGIGLIGLTLLAYLPGWIFETDLWVRIQAARDPRQARKGVIISIINSILFVGVFPLIVASAALLLFPPEHGNMPGIFGNEGDQIFTAITKLSAPVWLLPIISLGFIAASMSTIDTCVHVVSLSLGYDLFGRNQDQVKGKTHNYFFIGITIFLTWLFAINTESLWDLFYLSSGILSTTVALPMLGVYWKKLPAGPVMWSSVFGFITTIFAYVLDTSGSLAWLEPTWIQGSGLGYILWGMLAALIALIIGIGVVKHRGEVS